MPPDPACWRKFFAVQLRSISQVPLRQILGYPDDLKFRSSMTLFAHATSANQVFQEALQKYFAGEFDPMTLDRL
jgi:uncharacterized protein (DUF1810 family)